MPTPAASPAATSSAAAALSPRAPPRARPRAPRGLFSHLRAHTLRAGPERERAPRALSRLARRASAVRTPKLSLLRRRGRPGWRPARRARSAARQAHGCAHRDRAVARWVRRAPAPELLQRAPAGRQRWLRRAFAACARRAAPWAGRREGPALREAIPPHDVP